MTEYMCFRCCYKTRFRSSMIIHTNKKKRCERTIESIKYSDEMIFKLSFIPYDEAIQIQYNKIEENSNLKIKKTKIELLDIIKEIHKNKSKTCEFCQKSFNKLKDLKNHILSTCDNIDIILYNKKIVDIKNETLNNSDIKIETVKDDNIKNENIKTETVKEDNIKIDELNNTVNNTVNNTINNINSNNINNNNIININLVTPTGTKNIISFSDKWDTSHLTDGTKLKLFLSTFKYTKVLEHILKNNMNLNVLLDNESETGFVYNNEKIEKMPVSDIIKQSIKKIYNHLQDFSNEIIINDTFSLNPSILEGELNITEKKYKDFCEDDAIKKTVGTYFSDIYKNHSKDTKENFVNLLGTKKTDEIGF